MSIVKTETDLSELKINYLTQAMYDDALENDEINENELYFTPADNSFKNLVDGSAPGSVRGIGAAAETSNYTIGQYAMAEGGGTYVSGDYSHAEGYGSYAQGNYSHAEGYDTMAVGNYTHAQNYSTRASSNYQTAIGKYNIEDDNNRYALIIGNGTASNARSNALTVDWQGQVSCGDHSGVFKSIFDIFYPVGSYYETSDSTFDPNTAWGGTWSLETAGQVHVSAGTGYTIGDTGGNKDAIVPYHNHGFTDPQYQATNGSVADHVATACTRSTNVGISDHAAKNTGTGTSHSHAGASSHAYVMTSNTSVANTTVSANSSGNRRVYGLSASSGNPFTCVNNTGGEASHTHSVGAYSHTITQPAFTTPKFTHSFTQPTISLKTNGGGSVGYAGTSGNVTDANMQPYIVVNRWHRVA